ncbi:MarR family winged helix-turn-helix transcriptional regulator [Microbacterium betulae]|uniref:MarR family winged helix-turn-helix transcriptional regulator n=1 Tax=Microbacterium betulae TaxID=2981139 RepID=A0AA97I6N7_9MICO|nr:MarR family winged helix-turn-helix transcriptional regulator [Microbacterium sp. AB]WOF22817.1 MarR family winged helix-turn-helix transcriptional regulator [Microbacterium sp. AB]
MADPTESATLIASALARLRLGRRMGEGPFGGHGPFPHGAPHGGPHGMHEGGPRRRDPRGGFPPDAGGRADPPTHDDDPLAGRPRGPFGRSVARLRLLEVLASASSPLSVGELAERLGVDQPRASRLVQAVVETGHARREADPDDARRTLIALTDEGRALSARTHGARAEAVEQALAGFTPDEAEQLAVLLGRLADAWPLAPR